MSASLMYSLIKSSINKGNKNTFFNLGRRMGHTEVAIKFFKNNPETVIIVPTEGQRVGIIAEFNKRRIFHQASDVITASNYRVGLTGQEPKYIILDSYSGFTDFDSDCISRHIKYMKSVKHVVLLG